MSKFRLYNTLTKKVDDFVPQKDVAVKFYSCGPTVYDYPHIGNWYTFIRYDMLVRALIVNGYSVDWVMNITDVGHLVSDEDEGEDKLEKGAKRENSTAWQIAQKYTDYFMKGLDRLNIVPPNQLPKATDHISEQIDLIKRLEAKGNTYVIDDGVYFDTSTFDSYGEMANLDLSKLKEGARVSVNEQKHNPSDFALWKFSPKSSETKRDMEWWAPWTQPNDTSDEKHVTGARRDPHEEVTQGKDEQQTESYMTYDEGVAESLTKQNTSSTSGVSDKVRKQGSAVRGSWGFPGWHLECSAMSMKYLGETLDIHAGGIDHIPVHHTNEIAQSEAATGKPFSKFWFHANFCLVDGKKLSKSDGSFITLEDIEKRGIEPLAFRLLVLQSHYRTEAHFTWDNLQSAQNRLNELRAWVDLRHQPTIEDMPQELDDLWGETLESMKSALSNDLDTPGALAALAKLVNYIDNHPIPKKNGQNTGHALELIDQLLGLNLDNRPDITDQQKQLLAKRQTARDNKDFDESDRIRDELIKQKLAVRDTDRGQIWSRI